MYFVYLKVLFVSAGLLTLAQAISVIMGANIVEARLGKHLLTFGGLQLNLDKKTTTVDGTPVSLTPTEYALLHLLLVNRGKVLSRQQLMDHVWVGVVVTDRTVDVNITRLRKKLGAYASHIVSRPGFGYVFESADM